MIWCPLFKDDFGCAPAPSSEVGGLEAQDMRILLEQAQDGPAECAGSFPVDNPDLMDAPAPAFFEILGDEVLNLFGTEGMKVEHPIDRNSDRIDITHYFS